jgi:hypothetical protein
MPTPHARDAGLLRISRITGWVTAAAVSAVALISVGIARASDRATSPTTTTGATTTNPGLTGPGFDDPALTDPGINPPGSDEGPAVGSTGGSGLQPPPQPPTQGLGGGQAVSGGS